MPRIPQLTERVLARLSAAERTESFPYNVLIRQAWNITLAAATGREPLFRSPWQSPDDLWRLTFILAFGNQPEIVWAQRAEFAQRNGLIARGVLLELPARKGVQRETSEQTPSPDTGRARRAVAGGDGGMASGA